MDRMALQGTALLWAKAVLSMGWASEEEELPLVALSSWRVGTLWG
jgi:hypothetical protein